MLNFRNIFTKILICLVVTVIALPATVFMLVGSTSKVLAADKTKKVADVETMAPPSSELVKGLRDTYEQGEYITAVFVYSSKATNVWANISNIDPSFSPTVALKNQGDAGWMLTTPKFSKNLRVGRQTIEVFAQNSSGTTSKTFPINLKAKSLPLLQVKYAAGQNDIKLSWTPDKNVSKYLIEWKAPGSSSSEYKVVTTFSTVISNLQGGTRYEVKIKALDKIGETIAAKNLSLVTFGQKPAPQKVAGINSQSKQGVTPQIGEGVSTQAPKVAQAPKPNVSQSPTPQASESPSQGSGKEGWNRLLVALALLIIAAGVAIGGYYGYEWYASKSTDGEPPESKSSNRW